jgi:hypothetical protein
VPVTDVVPVRFNVPEKLPKLLLSAFGIRVKVSEPEVTL